MVGSCSLHCGVRSICPLAHFLPKSPFPHRVNQRISKSLSCTIIHLPPFCRMIQVCIVRSQAMTSWVALPLSAQSSGLLPSIDYLSLSCSISLSKPHLQLVQALQVVVGWGHSGPKLYLNPLLSSVGFVQLVTQIQNLWVILHSNCGYPLLEGPLNLSGSFPVGKILSAAIWSWRPPVP